MCVCVDLQDSPQVREKADVWRTCVAAFASVTFDPGQPSLMTAHNLPNVDLNKQSDP